MGASTMRTLWIEKSSHRTWTELDTDRQDRLKGILEEIANCEQPTTHPKVKLLEGTKKSVYRLRVGDYRVVFTTEQGQLRVHTLGNRNTVYRDVNNLYEAVS